MLFKAWLPDQQISLTSELFRNAEVQDPQTFCGRQNNARLKVFLSQVTEASKIWYDEGELGLQTELKLLVSRL